MDHDETRNDSAGRRAPLLSRRAAVGGLVTAGAALAPAGVAAIPRSASRLIYASEFGVLADGVTDDAPALIRATAALRDDTTLILPPGTLALGSPGWRGISVDGLTGIRVEGAATVLKWLAVPRQVTGPFGPAALRLMNCRGAVVRNLAINGNGIDCIGLALENCQHSVVSGVDAFAHGAASPTGLGQFTSCRGRHNTWVACSARNSTRRSQYRGFYLGNSNAGWGESDLRVEACTATGNDASGFAMTAIGLICTGSTASDNAGAGFLSATAPGSNSRDHLFAGNVSRDNAFHGWQTDVYGPNVERVVLSGNNFSNNLHCGILCHKATDLVVSGNMLSGNGAPTGAGAVEIAMSASITVSGNVIRGDPKHGVCVRVAFQKSVVTDVIIADNRCSGSSSKVVWLEALDDESVIRRVVCSGNIIDGGSHGFYVAATAPGAIIDDVVLSNNVVAATTATGFAVQERSPGQTSSVRLIANIGNPAVGGSSFASGSDVSNSWNPAMGHGEAPPTAGTWRRGSLIHNAAPSPGSPLGWICTVGGTPGRWNSFGVIDA
jgi:hypothetical protein